MRYFGEYTTNYCKKCSNCLTEFEEIDITQIAQAIAECVKTSRQRFGMTVITDTLHGSRSSKLKQNGMSENKYFGSLASVPVYRIRQVMQFLSYQGYILVTKDQYPIVKLTEKTKELFEDAPVMMKAAKEIEKKPLSDKIKKGKNQKKSSPAGTDYALFEELRKLRMEIAKAEKVPPYIVFSDKSLRDMSVKKPKTKDAFLTVNGVGEHKCQKYGERFLNVIIKKSL